MLNALNLEGWNATAWCVPSAVSIITGIPVGFMHMRAAFHQSLSLNKVKGLFDEEAILLFGEQGYRLHQIDLNSRYDGKPPTIQRFLKDRTPYEFCMPIYFTTVDHAMTCHMGYAADNWTKKPVPISEFPKLHRKVCTAYVVCQK